MNITARGAAVQAYSALWLLLALAGTLFFDRLTSVLLILSTLLFFVVCRYSSRYMQGDPGQTRFQIWLCLTASFVFVLVLSQNLLLFSLAWCGISLSLHQLLQFYRHRPAALTAARKKFLISRLGDAALVAALVLTYRQFGTWDFQEIFQRAAQLQNLPTQVSLLCACLTFAALLKSAQFPFHSWLPDTMETPTPVSALMHAGIINAGGILIIRLSPLISLSDASMLALCLVGSFTALFASFVVLTQASVKRCLAFSTVAQMGFMMLECGLGAFHLALVHLVAHSCYKAHAFLTAASAVDEPRAVPRWRPATHPATVLLCLAVAVGICFLTSWAMGLAPIEQLALNGIFSLAMAQMLWNLWGNNIRMVPTGLAAVVLLCVVYEGLERLAELVVKPAPNAAAWWCGLLVLAMFLAVALVQTQLHRLTRTAFATRLYVHARNGFYFNTLANRATNAVWPARIPQEEI